MLHQHIWHAALVYVPYIHYTRPQDRHRGNVDLLNVCYCEWARSMPAARARRARLTDCYRYQWLRWACAVASDYNKTSAGDVTRSKTSRSRIEYRTAFEFLFYQVFVLITYAQFVLACFVKTTRSPAYLRVAYWAFSKTIYLRVPTYVCACYSFTLKRLHRFLWNSVCEIGSWIGKYVE